MIEFLRSPWAEHFDSLIDQARTSLVISSPYIGREPCKRILAIKSSPKDTNQLSLLLLTDLSRDTLLSGATDASAIYDMAMTVSRTEIRFLPSIHAKVYVADEKVAVVTSANMTVGGLLRNFEYGVRVDEGDLVRKIKGDVTEYAQLGTKLETASLKLLAEIATELKDIRATAEKSIKSRLRLEFRSRLRKFEEQIIRTRVAGKAPHAIFADAILYLLARQPMSTDELHPLIQKIHPDLCDDSVDRVIDGRHFGKKWKHAVRTAQQYLKRMGQIELHDGLWHLKAR